MKFYICIRIQMNKVTIKEQLEKQLLCFETKNVYDKYKECLCEKFANFLLSLRNNKIENLLKNLDFPYRNHIEIIESKLYFKTYDINKIAVLVFEKLYEENNDKAFDNYINFIEKYIYENSRWFYLDFSIYNEYENSHIKNSFFNGALRYLKNNSISLKNYYEILKEKEFCKFDIQITDDIDMFYFSLKNSKFSDCFINRWYVNQEVEKIFNLLITIIKFYDYNTNYIRYKEENPIFKLLALKNDFINAILWLSNNIKLNIFYLKHFDYFVIGFINLIEIVVENCNEKCFKFLSEELLEILFKYFYRLDRKSKFYKKIFVILNILANKYYQSYIDQNQYIFYYEYLINKIFDFLEIAEINEDKYKKIFLFDFIFNDLVNLQIKFNKLEAYFLLSRYFKLAKNINIEINVNLYENIANYLKDLLNSDEIQMNFHFVEKIDFSIFYNEQFKNLWLDMIDIDITKQTWEERVKERIKRKSFSSKDKKEPKEQIKLYFKILSDIFIKTYDKDIQNKLIELAKHFGLDVEFGIFEDFIFDKDYFFENFLRKLNLFDKVFFENFLEELKMKYDLYKIVKLYNYTYATTRKKYILNVFKQLENLPFNILEIFNYNKSKIIETIELLLANELIYEAENLLNIINFESEELNYLKCEKEIIKVYLQNKDFDKLDEIKYIDNETNKGIESFYKKCEEYKTLIRALMLFDDEPEKTAIIIESEINKSLWYKELYFINLINAYLRIFIKEKNNFNRIKLLNSLIKYEKFLEENKINKNLFDYKTLLFSYIELNDYVKATIVIDSLPEYYLTDFEMIKLKYTYLKKFQSEIKATEFLDEYKKFMINEEIKMVEKERLEDLFEYRKKIRNSLSKTVEYHFAISFAGKYRTHLRNLYKALRKRRYKVFFDEIYKSEMAGEDLEEYLTKIFKYKAEFIVIFVSKEYKKRFYTNEVEKKAIIDREYFQDCIVQLKYDNIELDEKLKNTFYIDLTHKKIEQINWEEIAKILDEKYKSLGGGNVQNTI